MLTIHDLTFERNDAPLLRDIHQNLAHGEILQIRGENGSGKSTLLRILAGYIEPCHGTVLWNEQSIYQQREAYHQQLCYLGHQNGIKSELTVYENMKLSCALFNTDSNNIELTLDKMDLTKRIHAKACHLSAGQLRRLALTRLLLKQANLWVLDEPTTALDQHGQQLLVDLVRTHLKKSGSVILATHQHLDFGQPTKILTLGENHG
jgi:heme exporter protein A